VIIRHGEVPVLFRGIQPGDDEDRMPLVHQELDERIVGGQIEDVILHDPGRDDEDRFLVNLFSRRCILDQFDEVIPENHLAGCHGHLFPGAEILRACGELVVTLAPPVLQHIFPAPDEVLPPLLFRYPGQDRVGPEKVGRGKDIHNLPGHKGNDILVMMGNTRDAGCGVLPPLFAKEEGLMEAIEGGGLPGIIPKTGIAGDGLFRFSIGKQTGTENIVPVIGRFFPEILHNPVLFPR